VEHHPATWFNIIWRHVPSSWQGVLSPWVLASWCVIIFLGVAIYLGTRHLERVPRGWQNFWEWTYEVFRNFAVNVMGPEGERYMPFLACCFIYIYCLNLTGLIPGLVSPTTNYSMTAALALTVFVYVQYLGLRAHGLGYLKHFLGEPFQPMALYWVLAPLNVVIHTIGELAKPLSLSVRLLSKVSKRAKERGLEQLGTLGSGNHFLEVQKVDEIFDEAVAKQMGLSLGQVTIMLHTGSRGLGHQVATDYIDVMLKASKKYGIKLVDKQLAAAPFKSEEGQDYWAAMQCAANFAWANRQVITDYIRKAFAKVFGNEIKDKITVIYDVAHNIAKLEKHMVDGMEREVVVHRKGATRSFPAHHPELPSIYENTGQPVIIPGSMGSSSFLLVGLPGSMEQSWGSTCHGAGRVMSRKEAIRKGNYGTLMDSLGEKGILVRSAERETLLEEAPEAYKDVDEVVHVVEELGLNRKVARMRPMGVVKG